eukprot:g893.t1
MWLPSNDHNEPDDDADSRTEDDDVCSGDENALACDSVCLLNAASDFRLLLDEDKHNVAGDNGDNGAVSRLGDLILEPELLLLLLAPTRFDVRVSISATVGGDGPKLRTIAEAAEVGVRLLEPGGPLLPGAESGCEPADCDSPEEYVSTARCLLKAGPSV